MLSKLKFSFEHLQFTHHWNEVACANEDQCPNKAKQTWYSNMHREYCMQVGKQECVLYMPNTVTSIRGQEEDAAKVPVLTSNAISCQCQRCWLCFTQTPDTESFLPWERIRSFWMGRMPLLSTKASVYYPGSLLLSCHRDLVRSQLELSQHQSVPAQLFCATNALTLPLLITIFLYGRNMHIFFIFGDINSKMSNQIVYGQNKDVRASSTEV